VVFSFWVIPVASFTSVTAAFGTTAPLASVTVPERTDVDVCPTARGARRIAKSRTTGIRRIRISATP
jgi:hypothetical protein